MSGKFTLKDITYDITDTSICVEYEDMEIVLYPEVSAETEDEDVDYEMSGVRLYHNNGFNTHATTFEELKGKKFVWDCESNEDDEEAGCLYVQEHEDVTEGTIEILDVKNDLITIKWSGTANVFWDEKYGEDVPFETTFTAKLPVKRLHKINAFKTTKIKINRDTQLEILNLDEFNEEVKRISNSRQWEEFNTILKFKVTYCSNDYTGNVVFTNGKLNHVTDFDKSCPLKVRFENVDFNLKAEYEVFTFEV